MTAYLPTVICVKCGKPAIVKRVHDKNRNKRYVEASCHGQIERIPFADKPNEEVKLWGEPAPEELAR